MLKNLKKKDIGILADANSSLSYSIIKILTNSKYFNVKFVIFRKKNIYKIKKFNKLFKKKPIFFVSSFPHKEKKIKLFLKKNIVNLVFNSSWHNRLRPSFLNLFKKGIINFHPSPLPINRGCHTAFWGIYNNTSHGCTMHLMDNKIDHGKIIDFIKYKNKDDDLAENITKKSHNLSLKLLKKNLRLVYNYNFKLMTQSKLKKHQYHKKKDIQKTSTVNIKDKISVKKLWKLIRATKFKKNGYFIQTEKDKYLIRSNISKVIIKK